MNKPNGTGGRDADTEPMRRVKKALGSAAYDAPTWWRAQRDAKGIAWQEIDDDERERRLEELAQDYADRLSKEFGSKLSNNRGVRTRPFDPLWAAIGGACARHAVSPAGAGRGR